MIVAYSQKNETKHIASIVKWLISQVEYLGYKLKYVSIYIAFQDKSGNLVDFIDDIAPYYEITTRKHKTSESKYMVGQISETDIYSEKYGKSLLYIYGQEEDTTYNLQNEKRKNK